MRSVYGRDFKPSNAHRRHLRRYRAQHAANRLSLMLYATTDAGEREPATPGARGTCPLCRDAVQAKCGKIVVWHWAHLARDDCDPWSESETTWHRDWQEWVPPDQREIVIGRHRADIVTASGIVVELQHSSLPVDEIRAREDHYGRMIWLFDAREPYEYDRLDIRRKRGYATFRWKHPRKSLAACRKPVYLDLGYGLVLHLKRIYPEAPCGGSGKLGSVDDFTRWMSTPRQDVA